MNQPKVTVITPSYNRGHLIEDTIKSVLGQEYKNIEYIVIDGRSTDNTIDILELYKQEGKLTYISEKDEGMYFAINRGIAMATGDIVAYLNTDDIYFSWTVQRAVDVFQKKSMVDMVYGDSMVVDNVNNKKYLNIYAHHSRDWLPAGGVLCQPTVFLRRKVFEEVGYFNTEYKYLADCEFWLRINNNPKLNILKINEFMAIEHDHSETLRMSYEKEIKEEKNKIESIFRKEYQHETILRLIQFLNRELKLWKFVFMNYTKNYSKRGSWNYFLRNYKLRFSLLNYILCKAGSNRTRFPRFSINRNPN